MLPCSGVQYVGETDCSQQSSGTSFVYDGESNCIERGEQLQMADGRLDELVVHVEEPQREKQGEGHGRLPTSEGHCSRASCIGIQFKNQNSSSLPYFGYDDLTARNHLTERDESSLASENSHLVVDTFESELPSNVREGESSHSEPKWLERDETVALWVKWRGKWQAGIRCARADWPLSTLKAKPTHDRKKYFVIFFPHTRNYSWADMLLVRSIDEFPQPIAYRTHNVGVEMVKDLTVAQRFIMQKLAVSMLNIIDQLHTEALIETARDVMIWKEFASEASRCNGYSDLGRMLLKLQNMILQRYINSDWLQHSFHSWVQGCQNANSAESVELLKEELINSILWKEVNSWASSVQSKLVSERKTWKHEVMKWFSTSHPISSDGDTEQQSCDSPLTTSVQISRKRPKLEVRRAEAHASQLETVDSHRAITVDIDSGFFDSRDIVNAATFVLEKHKEEANREVATPRDSPGIAADGWDGIVVETGNAEVIQTKDAELTPVNEVISVKSLDPETKSRQCIAFIEAKGRRCVRLANDGDVYCCVHLASRFVDSSARPQGTPPVDTPMCGGTTTLGNRCKHRSLFGSSFCKKHRPQSDRQKSSCSPENKLKRKLEENISNTETSYCKDIILAEQVQSPLQVDPVSFIEGDAFSGKNSLIEKPEHFINEYNNTEMLRCIGLCLDNGSDPCPESPKRHQLYCEKHLPSWLKRARNGKSRIISKEVFIDLLKDCCSQEQKLHLHQACELFYRLFKSILSLRNPVPQDVQLQWALSEASKNFDVGEFLMKLVCSEKERLKMLWGFNADKEAQVSSSVMEEQAVRPLASDGSHDNPNDIKCKICSDNFLDYQALGTHWMDTHKKEAQWLFRGYACAICLDSFTNRKVLETHVQDRHHVQFVEQCMLFQCIPCGSHFGNPEELWSHVLSVHSVDFKLSKVPQQYNQSVCENSPRKLELGNLATVENNSETRGGFRKYICRFCGLKFDLLPDLGRHHQAAHMGPNLASSRPSKKGIRYYAYRLKSGRLSRPGFKKGLGAASYRIRNRASANIKKHIQASKSVSIGGINVRSDKTEAGCLGRLEETQCSSVAKMLFSEIQKTKPRPNNLDILSIARFACCKVSLQASLEGKYGVLPERLYLKAAKLCSEHNIQVEWHQEGFVCPKGCKMVIDPQMLPPLKALSDGFVGYRSAHPSDPVSEEWEMDECHYIIDSSHFRQKHMEKVSVLCDDISFGLESVPVVCIVDDGFSDSFHILMDSSDGQNTRCSMPWESFTYVVKPLLDHSLGIDTKSLQLGCACSHSICSPETCDHTYLFDNDYEDAKDIYGRPMRGRFPYDEKGRIVLEEGYLVYECNFMCSCTRACPNRVLQNGIRVKLEVFKTEKKGWAVRAGEPILRGTFVCEYIGEVIDEQEANKRRNRYGSEGCSYFYKIDAHINDVSRLIEEQAPYVIDATKYGNVSRFINHSCLPNLVNHQVLVESMDCQFAHIGFYASRDINLGEELTYDYQYELQPGEGSPCHCGASKCRGRLH